MSALAWGPILLAVYYAFFALRVASARKPGAIAPVYRPPESLTPAAVRYVLISGTDGKTIAAILVQLACRSLITLTAKDGGFEARRTATAVPPDLPHEEQVLMDLVFAFGDPNIIHPSDSKRMDGMVAGVEGALLKQYGGAFSASGYGKTALGVLLSLVWGLALSMRSGASFDKAFGTVWGLCFSLVLFAVLWVRAVPAWNDLLHGRLHGSARAWALLGMPLPLVMAGVAFFAISKLIDRDFALMLLLLAVINVIGGSLLRAPTPRGRKVLDQIAGYRQFLLAVEQDRMDRLNAPGAATPADANLPYAIALDIKEGWGDDLSGTFFAAAVSKG